MGDITMGKGEVNGNTAERTIGMSNAYWEETTLTPPDQGQEEFKVGEIREEWDRVTKKLDLASSEVVQCVRKAEEVRDEVEKIRDLLESKIAQLERRADGALADDETSASLAEFGEEAKNTEESQEEAEGQLLAPETNRREKRGTEDEPDIEEVSVSLVVYSQEEKNGEEPREEVERGLATLEVDQVEVAPQERPPTEGSLLERCMSNPSFRALVISRLIERQKGS